MWSVPRERERKEREREREREREFGNVCCVVSGHFLLVWEKLPVREGEYFFGIFLSFDVLDPGRGKGGGASQIRRVCCCSLCLFPSYFSIYLLKEVTRFFFIINVFFSVYLCILVAIFYIIYNQY